MKIVELPKPDNDFQASVAKVRRELPQLLEYLALKAKMQRAQYDALIAEGFDADQALALIAEK